MLGRHWSAFATVVLLVASSASSQVLEGVRYSRPGAEADAGAGVERPSHALPRTAPVMDGNLGDACWRHEKAYLGAFRLGLSPTPAAHSREAWACYDAENLYFAIKLQREPGVELRTLIKEDDDPQIWEDDEVEIFLDPFGSGTTYYQIILNSIGAVYDAFHSLSVVPDPKGAGPTDTMLERTTDGGWSCEAQREIAIHDDYWTIELALPLDSVGLAGAPAGHQVRFNVTSADWDTGEYTCLAPVSDWHDPQQFGALTLGEKRLDVTSIHVGRVGLGVCSMRARIADLSGEAGEYTMDVSINTSKGKARSERAFSLAADGRESLLLALDVRAVDGPWEADVRIVDARSRSVFAARRTGTVLPPLALKMKSRAAFADGADVRVAASIGLGDVTARRVELQAQLLDGRGRVVAEQDLGQPASANLTARMPVVQLEPGTYRLRLKAIQDDETIATAEDVLQVGTSPFAGR